MKLIKSILAAILFQCTTSLPVSSQNLVPNPGFEQHNYLDRAVCFPKEFSQRVVSWNGLGNLPPHQIYFTEDYQPNLDEIDHLGYDLSKFKPHSGRSMIQIYAHSGLGGRQYYNHGNGGCVSAKLKSPIVPDRLYKISFWYYIKPSTGSLLDTFFSQQLGVAFLNKVPASQSRECLFQSNTPLHLDLQKYTVGSWQMMEFYFTTECAFKHIVLGVFDLPEVKYPFQNDGLLFYYFIDDIELSEITEIPDSIREKTIQYPCLMASIAKEETEKAIWDNKAIYFSPGSAAIEDKERMVLDSVGLLLRKNKNIAIQLTGYTDKIGDQSSNLPLSLTRSISARKYLTDSFKIADFRMSVIGNGIDITARNEAYFGSRRVDFALDTLNTSQIVYRKALKYAKIHHVDSTVYYLRIWLSLQNENQLMIIGDPDFEWLPPRAWGVLMKDAKSGYQKYKQPELAFQLEKLFFLDQKYRWGYAHELFFMRGEVAQKIEKAEGPDAAQDEKNLKELTLLLKNMDIIPEPNEVSERGFLAIFYVLQHCNDVPLRKKFALKLEAICTDYKKFCSEYAMFYDRIMMDETGVQKYGTQLIVDPNNPQHHIMVPLIDRQNVNTFRKQIHLGMIDVDRY